MSDTQPQTQPQPKQKPRRSVCVTSALGLAWVGLAAATLAGRFGRFWWVADLFSHFAVYLALACVGLCVLAVLCRRWVWAGLALLILGVNGAVVWPVFAPGVPVESAGGEVIKIALVNVLHKNRDRDRVEDFLRRCGVDIVVVQEINPWWDRVLREADIPYRVVVSRPGEGSFGIALLVNEALDDGSGVALQSTRVFDFAEGFDGAERPSIQATLWLGGRRIRVLSIHPPPPVSAGLTALRDQVLRRARQWADEQIDPHIVIGDLNTTPWSYAFTILTSDGGLVSTQRGWGNQGTWPTTRRVPWMIPIDHCLVSEEWICLDRRIGRATGSDHLPLIVSLAIRPEVRIAPQFSAYPLVDPPAAPPGADLDAGGPWGEDIPGQPATIPR